MKYSNTNIIAQLLCEMLNVDYSHNYGRDVVDSFAERHLSYPVQPSDSTDVKQIETSKTENETSTVSLDSGFSRCDNLFRSFHI